MFLGTVITTVQCKSFWSIWTVSDATIHLKYSHDPYQACYHQYNKTFPTCMNCIILTSNNSCWYEYEYRRDWDWINHAYLHPRSALINALNESLNIAANGLCWLTIHLVSTRIHPWFDPIAGIIRTDFIHPPHTWNDILNALGSMHLTGMAHTPASLLPATHTETIRTWCYSVHVWLLLPPCPRYL